MGSKKQDFAAYDPRGAKGMGLGYATSNRGACHERAFTLAREWFAPPDKKLDPFVIEGKAAMLKEMQDETTSQRETMSRAVNCLRTTPGRGRRSRVSNCTRSPGAFTVYSFGLRMAWGRLGRRLRAETARLGGSRRTPRPFKEEMMRPTMEVETCQPARRSRITSLSFPQPYCSRSSRTAWTSSPLQVVWRRLLGARDPSSRAQGPARFQRLRQR